ncbi:hypothetical protein LCGC14_2120130 [marine sediment metagenome]|uniref:Uncharacterized protein n=1 Tax=marine sediment metagenome TaxID=412755 RepID=A0A0F9H0T6_9ZZZZ
MKKLITGLLTIGLITSLSLTAYGAKTYKAKTKDNEVYDKKEVVVEELDDTVKKRNITYSHVLNEIKAIKRDIIQSQARLAVLEVLRDAIKPEVDSVVLKPPIP